MGMEVQLRREDGEILDAVGDPLMILSRAAQNGFSGTHLLKYLIPWGDAVFNQAQSTSPNSKTFDPIWLPVLG